MNSPTATPTTANGASAWSKEYRVEVAYDDACAVVAKISFEKIITFKFSVEKLAMSCLPLQVTKPVEPTATDYISIVYGYMPAVFAALSISLLIIYRTSRTLRYATFPILNAVIVELLKELIEVKRPSGSACHSYGMPSGHSALSIGWLTMVLLDSFVKIEELPPLGNKALIISSSMLLLLPVPISRVLLSDHSVLQASVGSLLGIILGNLWFWSFVLKPRETLKVSSIEVYFIFSFINQNDHSPKISLIDILQLNLPI